MYKIDRKGGGAKNRSLERTPNHYYNQIFNLIQIRERLDFKNSSDGWGRGVGGGRIC